MPARTRSDGHSLSSSSTRVAAERSEIVVGTTPSFRPAPPCASCPNVAAIRSEVRGYAGLRSQLSTDEADRLAAAGATTGNELVVRVYGEDFATLQSLGEQVRQTIQTVSGVISPKAQQLVSEPTVEIEVRRKATGAPFVVLHGAAAETARRLGIDHVLLSLSHTEQTAIAQAMAVGPA